MSEFLFDLKHPEVSWSGVSHSMRADGTVGSDVGSITPPCGDRFLFWCLDTVMHKNKDGDDHNMTHMPHYHYKGYETFFVDSGSLYLYINGQKALAKPGDIVHLQAGQNHGMFWNEDVKWRGTYHDLTVDPASKDVMKVQKDMPELKDDPELKALTKGMDHVDSEPFLCKEVPTEECLAIKNPDRPWASYKLDGVTVKIIVERWENGGFKELTLFELEPGYKAEWVKYPAEQELYYLRKGKIKFKVMNEEFIADDECVISIPRFAPHSFEVLEKSDLYDMGGTTWWSIFMQDIEAIKHYDPARLENPEEIEKLKKKYFCNIKYFGK